MPRPVFKSVVFILLLALTGTGCLSALSEKTVGFPFTRKTPVADEADTAEAVDITLSAEAPDHILEATEPAGEVNETQKAMDEALDLCKVSQDFWQKGEFDNAIQALDQAYALMLKGDAENDVQLLQQKEDIRFLISKRILEIYTSRTTVVNGAHNAIPVTINQEVQKEIDLFTTGPERSFFIASYQRSGRYRPYILKKLDEAGLPAELSWLPLIESGFKTNALSKARALGLWQFIPSTGYKFGLERNLYVDQRLDPERATDAAIDYLTALHKIFGDWSTALAAYNCGEGKVLQVIRDQRVNYLDNFWDLYHRLPWETARYVPRFLATLHIVSNLEKYGMDTVVPDDPVPYEVVETSRQVHLKKIAEATGIAHDLLNELNPELRQNILPPTAYPLRVPVEKSEAVMACINSLPVTEPAQTQFAYHRVRSGETLSTIARRYRTSVSNIARANNIYKHNFIVAGKILKIPLSSNWVSTKIQKFEKAEEIPASHRVRSGESLWILANRYSTTVNAIQQLNGLSDTSLRVGQVLKIPGGDAVPATAAGDGKTYTVQPGDSPFTIARSHNIPLNRFLQINNLSTRSTIYPGQQVCLE